LKAKEAGLLIFTRWLANWGAEAGKSREHYTEAAVPDIVPHNPSSMIDIPCKDSGWTPVSEILAKDFIKKSPCKRQNTEEMERLLHYLITCHPIPREKTEGGQNVAPAYLDTAIKVPVDWKENSSSGWKQSTGWGPVWNQLSFFLFLDNG
jgi:hypothetical protein